MTEMQKKLEQEMIDAWDRIQQVKAESPEDKEAIKKAFDEYQEHRLAWWRTQKKKGA